VVGKTEKNSYLWSNELLSCRKQTSVLVG